MVTLNFCIHAFIPVGGFCASQPGFAAFRSFVREWASDMTFRRSKNPAYALNAGIWSYSVLNLLDCLFLFLSFHILNTESRWTTVPGGRRRGKRRSVFIVLRLLLRAFVWFKCCFFLPGLPHTYISRPRGSRCVLMIFFIAK